MAAPTFIRIRVSPAKAAISSDRVIAEELTGAWLPCQERSAFQWTVQSNYPSKAEYLRYPSVRSKLQNPRSDRQSFVHVLLRLAVAEAAENRPSARFWKPLDFRLFRQHRPVADKTIYTVLGRNIMNRRSPLVRRRLTVAGFVVGTYDRPGEGVGSRICRSRRCRNRLRQARG